jgi:hypothetical protein
MALKLGFQLSFLPLFMPLFLAQALGVEAPREQLQGGPGREEEK